MTGHTCYCSIIIIEMLWACTPIATEDSQGCITGYTFLYRCYTSEAGIGARKAELLGAIIKVVI